MDALHIVRVGDGVPVELLDRLAATLAYRLRVSCHVVATPVDGAFAWEPKRNQYWSTAILRSLLDNEPEGPRLLGITDLDLFVPVLTFVFGEAQIGGRAALVSCHRLRNEFYGLQPDTEVLFERLVKEALHELGHTFGLRHCGDWACVMTSSHAVEKLDVKSADFCPVCLNALSYDFASF